MPTYVICRLGNDSQVAVEALRRIRPNGQIQDIIGGLRAWSTDVDPDFPIY
jgi:adenylyltransferase/sulfurtransferase